MRPEQVVEATLFASQTPLTASEIARADERLEPERVVEAIQWLRNRYEEYEHSFQIYQLGDGFQILTRPEFAPYLERFDSVPRSPHLSPAALETLAIIAYRQPIGRIEIEDVRGVNASSVLRTLLDWELVEVVIRGEGLGRPLLYGVTQKFLEHFGLKDLAELPAPDELPVILGELQEELEEKEAAAVAGTVEQIEESGGEGEPEEAGENEQVMPFELSPGS
jgi:segregation and condensation protein B